MEFLCTGVSDRNFPRDCVTCQVDYWLGELSGELHRRYQKQVGRSVDLQQPPGPNNQNLHLPNDGFHLANHLNTESTCCQFSVNFPCSSRRPGMMASKMS